MFINTDPSDPQRSLPPGTRRPRPAAVRAGNTAVSIVTGVSDDPQLQEFLGRLAVTAAGSDTFFGTCQPAWPGRAFGGQLAAQILQAAAATVPEEMSPESLHVYFHAPVRANEPAQYLVERVKQGRTLASRRVRIEQDGSLKASAMALFGVPADGPSHEYAQPPALDPEQLPARARFIDTEILPLDADWQALGYPAEALIDLRMIENPAVEMGYRIQSWMKVVPRLPEDPLTVASTLAYLSDLTLGSTAMGPHGGRANATDLQLGALELALWFAGPARLHEWTLFSTNSAFAGYGHGLAHGIFHNSDGDVAAIAVQNALMRKV